MDNFVHFDQVTPIRLSSRDHRPVLDNLSSYGNDRIAGIVFEKHLCILYNIDWKTTANRLRRVRTHVETSELFLEAAWRRPALTPAGLRVAQAGMPPAEIRSRRTNKVSRTNKQLVKEF